MYAENCLYEDLDLSVVHEFVFKKTGANTCTLATRFLSAGETILPESTNELLFQRIKTLIDALEVFLNEISAKL
jgi:hypothetical protein